jgi:hypothetical protein
MAIIKVRNPAIDLDAAEIPNLDASKISTGTIDNARISLDANEIPNLDTSKITSGTFADARMPSTVLNSNVDLTNLSASSLTSGTIPDARFPATLPAISGANLTGISAGTYSIHAIDTYYESSSYQTPTATDYYDIANGQYVQFTPTSTNDLIQFSYTCPLDPYSTSGLNTYLMMSTSTSIGSGDTKLDYDGRGQGLFVNAPANARGTKSKTFIMPCTSLTVGTTYYVEQAGSSAANGNYGGWNNKHTGHTGDFRGHHVSMIHFKYNG